MPKPTGLMATIQRASALIVFPALVLLVALAMPAAASASAEPTPLEQRLAVWPQWRLPAPLQRPGRRDLTYPSWFAGEWRASSDDLADASANSLRYRVRFLPDGAGAVVGDRAFNAMAIGKALLGDQLLEVRNDPRNPNRQLARLRGEQQLESTVVGRRSDQSDPDTFLADELALQVMHGSAEPRISRVETLSRYHRIDGKRIAVEQWQAIYDGPANGWQVAARSHWHGRLLLERLSATSDAPT